MSVELQRTERVTAAEANMLILATEKQVFGFDRRAAELAGLIACKEDYATGSLCISFEHDLAFKFSSSPEGLQFSILQSVLPVVALYKF